MKAKSFEIEAFTVTECARIFGYKTTAVLYRLLNSGKFDDYIWTNISGQIYIRLEPTNQITLAK